MTPKTVGKRSESRSLFKTFNKVGVGGFLLCLKLDNITISPSVMSLTPRPRTDNTCCFSVFEEDRFIPVKSLSRHIKRPIHHGTCVALFALFGPFAGRGNRSSLHLSLFFLRPIPLLNISLLLASD